MTYSQWRKAFLPKVIGTMNIHKHLSSLNFFIMLSSVSGVAGSVSQSSYAAGNTFQDALARNRTGKGLPAVVIDLGPVASVGVIAESDASLLAHVEKNLGFSLVPIDCVLRLVCEAIKNPLRKTRDDCQFITSISQYDKMTESMVVRKDKRFGTLRLGNSRAVAIKPTTTDASARLAELIHALSNPTTSSQEAVGLITAALARKLADLFNVASAEIEADLPLSQYGVDSLVAVELRNWLNNTIKAKVAIFEIIQAPSVTGLAGLIVGRSSLVTDVTMELTKALVHTSSRT
jgi:hypothetical protein